MTTTVHPRPIVASPSPPVPAARSHSDLQVTERRVIRSEWIKLRSVLSLRLGFLAAAFIAVVLAGIFASSGDGGGPKAAIDSLSLSLAGLRITQLIIGVLGVVVVSSEYSTGLIRSTLQSVRSRLSVLRAKSVVFATSTFVVVGIAACAAFFVGKATYGGIQPELGLSDPGVVRVLVGTVLYTVGVGLFGVALGFLLRGAAAAIGVLFATLLIVPALAGLLPWSWATSLTEVLPSNAGDAVMTLSPSSTLLSPTSGAIVVALWVVGLLVLAGVALRSRDA